MGYPIYHSAYTAAQIEAAIGKGPRINASGYWEVWNVGTGAYESTGVGAGVTPPTVVTQVADMTNHGYIYIYNGTETGYTPGYWYYWNGSAWTAGGAYQVAATDPTLSVSGAAADAKATGDAVGELKSTLNFNKTATPGYLLRATNTGNGSEWSPVGLPTDEQTADAVTNWLNNHPEATTTVQDHSLSYIKLITGTLNFVTPEMFGAVGDGINDDTTAIQNAIDTGLPVVFRPKTYIVSAENLSYERSALKLKNKTVLIGNGATIKLTVNSYAKYAILQCLLIKDVLIENLIIEGDQEERTSTSGEQGHGIAIIGCKNITVNNCTIKNCHGDGINIAATYERIENSVMTEIVTLSNLEISENWRQGISVEGCDTLFIENVKIYDIHGVAPQSGIDFEPSGYYDESTQQTLDYEYIDNVFVRGLTCEDIGSVAIIIDDILATRKGKYHFDSLSVGGFWLKSRSTTKNYGSEVDISNSTIFTRTGSNVTIELMINNSHSNMKMNNVTCDTATNPVILMDTILKGKVLIDGITIYGNRDLVIFSESGATAGDGLVIRNIFAPDGLKYPAVRATAQNFQKAQVSFAVDIVEVDKDGWFTVKTMANKYIYTSNIADNVFIQLQRMPDGFEITIINGSSYYIAFEKDSVTSMKLYDNNLSPVTYISVPQHKFATIKYESAIDGWIVVNGNASYS